MLVGDLIYNNNFDVNCNYAVYDCTDSPFCWHELEPVFSTLTNGYRKPLDKILDMKIRYITIDRESGILIIEAIR